jgi:hypothetical protein
MYQVRIILVFIKVLQLDIPEETREDLIDASKQCNILVYESF